jgi:hypothetical protein
VQRLRAAPQSRDPQNRQAHHGPRISSASLGALKTRVNALIRAALHPGHETPNSANGRHGKQNLKKTFRLRSIKLSRL